jgi:hypothetical protein
MMENEMRTGHFLKAYIISFLVAKEESEYYYNIVKSIHDDLEESIMPS